MPRSKKHPTSHRSKKTADRSWVSHIKLGSFALAIALPIVLAVAGLVTATQFENHDSFCSSCHTQPESTYFQRESSSPVDLASFHSTKTTHCIDCHSGKGVPGRASAVMLGANDLIAFVTHNYKQPAPLTHPISDVNCLKCHADISQRRDFNNHFHVFLPQWQARDPTAATCVDCHQSHVTDGDAKLAYLNQDTTSQVCQRCHNFAGEGG